VPGSSRYFLGSFVTYSNELKTSLLGVSFGMLAAHGAVSEPVARAMALAARERLGSSFAIAVTGIAGPGGGSEEKPVGSVHLAVAGPRGEQDVQHRFVRLPGDRARVRTLASQMALELLRTRLRQGRPR
jgi:PncC family amidohydrolase